MQEETEIREGFTLLKYINATEEHLKFSKQLSKDYIQLHFCIQEQGSLSYGPHYSLDVIESNSLILYNPDKELPINLSLNAKGKYVIFIVKIGLFHSFFSKVADIIPFLNEENKHQKFYFNKPLTPEQLLVLNQLVEDSSNNSMRELYLKAKVYELLSLYFGKTEESKSACPFLDSEENVERIKRAKQIIIDNMSEPPTLQELADEIGLSLAKLKEGFKHIYGDSVFNFLLDYKLEYARKQLLSKSCNVSEISLQVGYSTASHFISAFKKKYGTTPKQYILSVN